MLAKTFFFSWQSDIPSGCNKRLIEEAVQLVIDERKAEQWHLEERLDEATTDVNGAVDIVAAITKKIDLCSVFIADVTLINPGVEVKRRSPNPNVLFELGYAVSVVGWENIILVFNEAYGKIKDVPFDIQGQRIFKYKLMSGTEKEGERLGLAQQLQKALAVMLENQPLTETIKTAIKLEVDYELMDLGNHIFKLLYEPPPLIMPVDILEMMSLEEDELMALLAAQRPLGFQVLKSWESYLLGLRAVKNNAVYAKYMSNAKMVALILLIEQLEIALRNFMGSRFYKPRGEMKDQHTHHLHKGRNNNYRLLVKSADGWENADEGIFYEGDQEDLFKVYQADPDELPILAVCLAEIFKAANAVIAAWGGMIIANPALTRLT